MMKKRVVWSVVVVLAIALAAVVAWRVGSGKSVFPDVFRLAGESESGVASSSDEDESDEQEDLASEGEDEASGGSDESVDGSEEEEDSEEEEPQTEEERREAEEEAKVDAFDDLTDKWMEPAEKGVTMADVDNFAKQFRQVPKARQDECIHRALNLVPDENVMLLAGILMDKSMDKEIVETVFNDILNRDEDVKKPILQQIFKDKAHPCWSDAAWILDVTGELPDSK